jgi:integrase
MLLLIATYGLRGCEVRALRLRDVDWKNDELTIVSPKTGRRRALPLTRPVGDAVLDYLLEEQRKAIERCPGPVVVPNDDGRWHTNKDIIQWLDDL